MATKKATHDKTLHASGLVSLNLLVPGYIKERLEQQSLETGQSVDQVAAFLLDEKRVEDLAKLLIQRELDSRYGHYEKFLENQVANAERMRQGVERVLKNVGIVGQKPKRKSHN
jgi:hypothetical protein